MLELLLLLLLLPRSPTSRTSASICVMNLAGVSTALAKKSYHSDWPMSKPSQPLALSAATPHHRRHRTVCDV
jgi:hypothetical protein